jgi:hypothetical protein
MLGCFILHTRTCKTACYRFTTRFFLLKIEKQRIRHYEERDFEAVVKSLAAIGGSRRTEGPDDVEASLTCGMIWRGSLCFSLEDIGSMIRPDLGCSVDIPISSTLPLGFPPPSDSRDSNLFITTAHEAQEQAAKLNQAPSFPPS